MVELFAEFAQRIEAGQGSALTITGMGVVFSGLLLLFITMTILQKAMAYREKKRRAKRKMEKLPARREIVSQDEDMKMDEVAAAIGLALHFHMLRHRSNEITIKRVVRSPWKELQRSRALERL